MNYEPIRELKVSAFVLQKQYLVMLPQAHNGRNFWLANEKTPTYRYRQRSGNL